MKKKFIVVLLILCLLITVLCSTGLGLHCSSSAVADLKAELEGIYGTEYEGKVTANGTEDMVFVVKPKTWLFTNWNLRDSLGLDYKYECQVVFTIHSADNAKTVRTITYQAVDPMGENETMYERAHLDLTTKTEKTGAK